MKLDAFSKLENILAAKNIEKQQNEEDKKELEKPLNIEKAEFVKQDYETSGIKIYKGIEGTVYLKENDSKKL